MGGDKGEGASRSARTACTEEKSSGPGCSLPGAGGVQGGRGEWQGERQARRRVQTGKGKPRNLALVLRTKGGPLEDCKAEKK